MLSENEYQSARKLIGAAFVEEYLSRNYSLLVWAHITFFYEGTYQARFFVSVKSEQVNFLRFLERFLRIRDRRCKDASLYPLYSAEACATEDAAFDQMIKEVETK